MQSKENNLDVLKTKVNMNELEIDGEVNDDESSILSDEDECTEIELKNNFKSNYSAFIEKSIAFEQTYVLYMDCFDQKVCVGLSNNTCEVHEMTNNQITKLVAFEEHSKNIIDVKFSLDNNNLVYTGSADGSVKIWDLRTPKQSVNTLTDPTCPSPENVKPFSCFDVSSNERLICAGTDLYEGDSFLLFWDVRNTKLLGGYWESHMDDVTKVKFHPTQKDTLSSCSTDGLVNVYDLTQTSEDDALVYSLNTESSAEQILWYKHKNRDAIASVTHPSELQLWNIEEAVPYVGFKREDFTKAVKRKSAEHCYIANVHNDADDEQLIILIGSNWHNGEIVRGVNITNNCLHPSFILDGNIQRIRASYYDIFRDIFVTGGESGVLTIWKRAEFEPSTSSLKSITKKQKLHNKKPY